MTRFGLVAAPFWFALRRMRERPLAVGVLALALAAAGGLLGWSSVAGALAHEENVRLRLGELRPEDRAVQVVYHLAPEERDDRAVAVATFFGRIEGVTTEPRRVRLWHSVGPEVRLVVAGARDDVALTAGRLPRGCTRSICEAVSLLGAPRLGQRVRLGGGVDAKIVGLGALRREALPLAAESLPHTPELRDPSLLIREMEPPLAALARFTGSSVVTTAALDPGRIHGADLPSLTGHLREELVRVERAAESTNTAPLTVLDELTTRGEVARNRLLLIAGQGAALIIAFAAFAASLRRYDTRRLDEQLATLGASRVQIVIARIFESLLPGLLGALTALGGLWLASRFLERGRDLGASFQEAALPPETIIAIAGVTAGAVAILVLAAAPRRPARLGVGALELAALAALGVVAWQTAATGALDPERVEAAGTGPVLLLVPALAFFATAVLVLRLVPLLLRLAERVSRTAPFSVRLAFIAAARNPAQAAAATTFLAVALGSALFALNYRATLERQARDEAAFTSGASWRVTERAAGDDSRLPSDRRGPAVDASAATGADVKPVTGAADVTPLTRFARATDERPTPVVRVRGRVREAGVGGGAEGVEVLAVPASRIGSLLGWRDDFSSLSRREIAARLRPAPVRLSGLRLARDAQALRMTVRADTRLPRFAVLHFLLPEEQRFAHVRLGDVTRRWRSLRSRLPRSLRGAELVGLEFPPVFIPYQLMPDFGSVELAPLEQRRGGEWSPLPRIDDWSASAAGGSVDTLRVRSGPVRQLLQFQLEDAPQALIRPSLPLPDPVPVLASDPVAAAAVDGTVTLDLQGRALPARVVGSARLFPTVTTDPARFVVVDYETLFAALNLDQPGLALPSEAWFFEPKRLAFLESLRDPPFRLEAAVGRAPLTERLLTDPLAAGTREVLGLAAFAAAALGLLGLVLAARSTLSSERMLLAEYEALGVPPTTLARSTQLRLVALSLLGVAAGVLGGLLAVRLIGAFVAVTGTSARPLPPIEPVVAWTVGGALLGFVAAAAVAAAAILAATALRETAARRLRA